MAAPKKYPNELRERATRMAVEARRDRDGDGQRIEEGFAGDGHDVVEVHSEDEDGAHVREHQRAQESAEAFRDREDARRQCDGGGVGSSFAHVCGDSSKLTR